VILKSYIVEQNIGVLNNYQATLIYGQNDGIKDDIKEIIKRQNIGSEIIIFFEDEIFKNKDILFQNFINESLFHEKKIIFIHQGSDKIYEQLIECLDKKNKDIKIFLFSENLEKKSKIRKLFEKEKNLAILPCYEDGERTLVAYISKELKEFKGLTGEIINLIISNSNMNRKVIKSELIKIKDFFLQKKINKIEVLELLNAKSNTAFDKVRDSALNGEKKKISELMSKIDLLNEDTFFYLNSLNYRIVKLEEIIKVSKMNKNNYEQVIESLKPPVFWKDRPIIIAQLKKWRMETLSQISEKIGETEILMKKNSYLRKDIVIKNLIINITSKASLPNS